MVRQQNVSIKQTQSKTVDGVSNRYENDLLRQHSTRKPETEFEMTYSFWHFFEQYVWTWQREHCIVADVIVSHRAYKQASVMLTGAGAVKTAHL